MATKKTEFSAVLTGEARPADIAPDREREKLKLSLFRCNLAPVQGFPLNNLEANPRAPLHPLLLMEVPFDRVGMDLIGPLECSTRGYRFVLVLVDYTTRYPEAVPQRNISAKNVWALFNILYSPVLESPKRF